MAGFPGLGWNAIRTSRWKYVEWGTGERELYDLQADPYEMINLFFIGRDTTQYRALLKTRLASAHDLRGPQLRDAGRIVPGPLSHLPKGGWPE